jgi:hypothetical protein
MSTPLWFDEATTRTALMFRRTCGRAASVSAFILTEYEGSKEHPLTRRVYAPTLA